jgi:hypothetical protein
MGYSATQAAKAVGVSVPTITRAIKSGKVSAQKLDVGGYDIEPAELHRVFKPVPRETHETPSMLGHETPNETGVLQVEIKLLREMLADKDGTIADLRTRLDAERDERLRLTALLTHQPETSAISPQEDADEPRRGWWLFGARNR